MSANITLLRTLLLPDFPSASAVEYREDKLYLVGDDATCIIILDKNYRLLSTIPLTDAPGKRIPKAEKADLEASALIRLQGSDYLLASGSMATAKRRSFLLLPLAAPEKKNIQWINYPETFIQQLFDNGIPELNIEGATVIGNRLVFSNRGNDTHPQNQLVITTPGFWEPAAAAAISVVPLTLLTPTPVFAGVSGLCYVPEKDLLLCSLSSEATANAYDDGEIGDSYIGWIKEASQQLSQPQLTLNGIVNLSAAHNVFKGEKIEGICVEAVASDHLVLHLVSDNDGGESRLFKIRFALD